MKIRLDKQSSFLIILAAVFAALYSWIEYYILVGVLQEAIYTKIIFWMAYLAVAFAFAAINPYAGFASFAVGAFIEDSLYRFLSKSNYYDSRLMVALLAIVLILIVRAALIFEKNDKQKFEIMREGPPILEGKEAEAFLEDIKKPSTLQQIQTVERAQQEFKPPELVEIKVSEEEKFDPEKEERKKRIKERFLKKQKEKYNGK